MEVSNEHNWDTSTECAWRMPSSHGLEQRQVKVFGAEEITGPS